MNKRGEALVVNVVLLILLLSGIVAYENKLEDKKFVGDSKTKIVYNLNSVAESCDISTITIKKENTIFFKRVEEATTEGFSISEECP